MGRAGAPRVGELCEGLLQHCDAGAFNNASLCLCPTCGAGRSPDSGLVGPPASPRVGWIGSSNPHKTALCGVWQDSRSCYKIGKGAGHSLTGLQGTEVTTPCQAIDLIYNRIAFLEGVPRLPAASVSLGEPPSSGGAETMRGGPRDESGRLIFPDKSGGLIFLSVGGDDGDRLVRHVKVASLDAGEQSGQRRRFPPRSGGVS